MNKEKLIDLINEGLSCYKIAKKFNLSKNTIIYYINKLDLKEFYDNRPNRNYEVNKKIKDRYDEKNFRDIVKISKSLTDVIKNLGIKPRGHNYKTVKKYIEFYNIDISHFNPYNNKNKKFKDIQEYLKENIYIKSSRLKEHLYKSGLKDRICEFCGQGENWLGKKISLILDHKNGEHTDNRLENLRILCPNCNAALDTHCGKNKNKDRGYIDKFTKSKKSKVTLEDKLNKKGICLEILKKEVWEIPTVLLCKKYNISDVGLGKICKKFNINKPPRGYWTKKKNSDMV